MEDSVSYTIDYYLINLTQSEFPGKLLISYYKLNMNKIYALI